MAEATITPTENGPYRVEGDFQVMLSDGTVLRAGGKAFLCRCGDSKSKPFCDGTHSESGFICDNLEMGATGA